MTFKDIFGSAASPTSSNYYKGYHPVGNSRPVMSEKEGIGYGYGHAKLKTGNKMDKKHAAMSALTLLAFLFFLNILQNCLREQVQPFASDVTMMMIMPAKQIKHSSQRGNDEKTLREEGRKTRSLLEVRENGEESTAGEIARRTKFIHDLKNVNRKWKNALTQLTDEELENQRMKTDNLQLYLAKLGASEATEAGKSVPVASAGGKLSTGQAKKSEMPSPKANHMPKAFVRTWNRKRNFGDETETTEDDWVPSMGHAYLVINGTSDAATGNNGKMWEYYKRLKRRLIKNRKIQMDNGNGASEPTGESFARITKETQNGHSIGQDLDTLKTHPTHTHRNHKYPGDPCLENRTAATPMPTAIYGVTAERYPSIRLRKLPPKRSPFQQNRNRIHGTSRPGQPDEFGYKYSPYRRASNHQESLPEYHGVHYPIGTAGEYHREYESGFDFIRFIRAILSGFSGSLSKIVPGLVKVGSDDSQCYDLLICEAHRVGRLLGPTAESLASVFSTLAMWYAAEENRQSVIDAVRSGKENTCQQQILDCNEKSGGKSAMTVLARFLETKVK